MLNEKTSGMHLDPAWVKAAEALPVIVWTARPDGSVEYVNRRLAELTGLGEGQITSEQWRSLVHPEDLPAMVTAFAQAIAQGTPFAMDLRVRVAGGAYRWMRSACGPMHGENNRVERWFGVMLDVEETHRAQERFRVLGEAVPVIVWSADADGWIDWYNGRWHDYTGQTAEEARGWGWQAAHHPDDFLEVMQRWPHSIENGLPFEMEFRLRRYDGVFHWFLTRVEPFRDETGKIVRWYGSNVDIDAQKTALERSKRIAETLQDVFLPKELPQYPDLHIDGAYVAAERDALIGGDWYDSFELPDGRVAFSIGDVAGHGLEASVLVGRLRQVIYTLAFKSDDPGQILNDANHILNYQNPDMFVTAVVGFVNSAHDRITYANAGHPPPLVVREHFESSPTRKPGQLPLGVSAQTVYANQEIEVRAGTMVVLYTDGMTDFGRDMDAAEEKLKAAAVLIAGKASVANPGRAIQQLVLNETLTSDDAAVLVLHFAGFKAGAAQADAPIERSWRFHSSDAYSAHASRREIMSYLHHFVTDPAESFATELVAGELLANTVEHAPGLVEITITWQHDKAIMTVRDSGPGMHRISHDLPEDPLDENGRGLFLVKQLAEDLRVKASPGFGAEVRVTLPMRRRYSSAS